MEVSKSNTRSKSKNRSPKTSKKSKNRSPKTSKKSKKSKSLGLKIITSGYQTDDKKITTAMETLDKQLKEKDLNSFWVFPDQGFKKKFRMSYSDIEKMIANDKKEHENIVDIKIMPFHDRPDSIPKKNGIWLRAGVAVYPIKNKKILNKKSYGINIHWKKNDFLISKLTLKLLEHLMKLTLEHKLSIVGVYGVPFNELIDELKYKKIYLDKFLSPLVID